jgi:hypothetical protein
MLAVTRELQWMPQHSRFEFRVRAIRYSAAILFAILGVVFILRGALSVL